MKTLENFIERWEGEKEEVEKVFDTLDTNDEKLIERFKELKVLSDEILEFKNMAAKVAKINEQIKKGLHEPFDYQIEDYINWIELIKHNQNLEVAAKELSRSLPSKEAVDKILRYETAIERQLYRAIHELERVQRRRQGEFVPPPINVDVSNGDAHLASSDQRTGHERRRFFGRTERQRAGRWQRSTDGNDLLR